MLNLAIDLPAVDTGEFVFGEAAQRVGGFTIPIDDINEVYLPHLENNNRIQIFYGGSSSGKSVFLSQRTVIDVLN